MYSAYVLTEQSRELLLSKFVPQYDTEYAHHVTQKFGAGIEDVTEAVNVEVVGYIDSSDGIEAVAVLVNGERYRPDGKHYHITMSIDSNSEYKPKDSNELISNNVFNIVLVTPAIPLQTTPMLLR